MTKKKLKKSLILLEIILASCLAALFVGFLFKTYLQFQTTQVRVEKLKKIVFSRQKAYLRLQQIFLRLTHYSITSEGMVLKYKSPLDPEVEFRGECASLLHLKDDLLILTTWAPSSQEKIRQEILLKASKESFLEFHIFDPEKKTFRPLSLEEPPPESPLLKICIDGTYFPFHLNQQKELSQVIEEVY